MRTLSLKSLRKRVDGQTADDIDEYLDAIAYLHAQAQSLGLSVAKCSMELDFGWNGRGSVELAPLGSLHAPGLVVSAREDLGQVSVKAANPAENDSFGVGVNKDERTVVGGVAQQPVGYKKIHRGKKNGSVHARK